MLRSKEQISPARCGGSHDREAVQIPGTCSQFFSALISNAGDGSDWLGDSHAIVTVMLAGDDPAAYFSAGDHFSLWLGSDIADGVVTRRLFV